MIRPWFRQAAVPWKTTATQTRATGENRVSTKPGVLQGVIGRVAAGTRLAGPVQGKRARLLTTAFMLRAIVLMMLMPDADPREVVLALAGDLGLVAGAGLWRPASPRSFGQWRQAIGPEPLEGLQDLVLGAARDEHDQRDWR